MLKRWLKNKQIKDIPYASVVGSFNYCRICSRFDAAFVMSVDVDTNVQISDENTNSNEIKVKAENETQFL